MKGVPSGWRISQYILTTRPWLGLHGIKVNVDGSGCKNKSHCTSSPKPSIAEASKEIPSVKALSSSFGIIETFFCLPYMSKKASLINCTSSSRTNVNTSL